MMTIDDKNELAFNRVDYCDTPSLVFELLQVAEQDPDWRMTSLVGYHLMRRYFDDDTFMPQEELEMENVQMPLCGRYWKLPHCAMFPACQIDAYPYADDCSDAYLINLCSFVEDAPVIGFRYACDAVLTETKIIKGLVSYADPELAERYPGWEFYQADRSKTKDDTAMLAIDFGHVHRVEIAHYSKEDRTLHRVFASN